MQIQLLTRGILVLSVLFCMEMRGQKVVKKAILNSNIEFVQINTTNCFKVETATSTSDTIQVEATIDGEYKKDLIVTIDEEGQNLTISAGFQPGFIHPNDKLSAHKVLSISLKITIPEYKKVKIYGTTTSVFSSGKYKNLWVVLSDGKCVLNQIKESAEVTTQSGDIVVYQEAAEIEAKTKYGSIEREPTATGKSKLKLTSTTGNISIKKWNK